jgi:hypothetical protein
LILEDVAMSTVESLDEDRDRRPIPALEKLVRCLQSRALTDRKVISLCRDWIGLFHGELGPGQSAEPAGPEVTREAAIVKLLRELQSGEDDRKEIGRKCRVMLGIAQTWTAFHRIERDANCPRFRSFTVPSGLSPRFVQEGDVIVGERCELPRDSRAKGARDLLGAPIVIVWKGGDDRSWVIHRFAKITRELVFLKDWTRCRTPHQGFERSKVQCLYRIIEVARPSHRDSEKDKPFQRAMVRAGFAVAQAGH